MTEVSAVVEYAGGTLTINWEETLVLDKARGLNLLTEEVLHIWITLTSADKCINKEDQKVPDC